MRRVGVTLEDVAEAAETLYARGENPTIDRIRAQLGGTGSNTTIAKYLQTWRARATQSVKSDSNMAPPDPVQIAVKRVWQQIREETDTEIEAIKSETQAIIQEAEARLTIAHKENLDSKTECEGLQAQVHALQAKSEIQQLDFQQLTTEYRVLQERYLGLEKRGSDAEITMMKQHADMALLHQQEVARLNEKISDQATAHQKLVDTIKQHAEDERTQHMRETDSLKTSYHQLREAFDSSTLAATEKDRELISLKTENDAFKLERDALATQLQILTKYGDIIEKYNQITNNIWSELKTIPKADVWQTYFTNINELQQHIDHSMQRLDKATLNTAATADIFNQIQNLLKKRELA